MIRRGVANAVASIPPGTFVETSAGYNLSKFGAPTGDDWTVPFQAALVAFEEMDENERRPVILPPGDLHSGPILAAVGQFLDFRGAGWGRTRVWNTGSGAWLTLGEFDATPATPYIGTAADYRLLDFTLSGVNPSGGNVYLNEGARLVDGIRDNGSGGGTIRGVWFRGLRYGFAAPYGSDFTVLEDCRGHYCDVAAYLGPSSQQFVVNRLQGSACMEGLVLENPAQGKVANSWFVDNVTSDITFDYSDSSRFGVTPVAPASAADLSVVVEDCWFESGAGFTSTAHPAPRCAPRHIWLQGDAADLSYPRHIKIIRPRLVAGGPAGTHAGGASTNTFLEHARGRWVELHDLRIVGENVASSIKISAASVATSPPIFQKNTRTTDGFTTVPLWSPAGGAGLWSQDDHDFSGPHYVGSVRIDANTLAATPLQLWHNSNQTANVLAVRNIGAGGAVTARLGPFGHAEFPWVATKYKSAAAVTIADADFYEVPIDGSLAVVRNSTTGKSYMAYRSDGAWLVMNEVHAPAATRLSAGGFYRTPGNQAATALTQSLLTATPLRFDRTSSVVEIGCAVTVGAGSSTIRLGIYAALEDGRPGALVVDAGTVDSTGSGVKSIVIAQSLPGGIYWLGAVAQGGAPTANCVANNGATPLVLGAMYGNSAGNCVQQNSGIGYSVAAVTGTLPDPFGTVTTMFAGANACAVYVKAA